MNWHPDHSDKRNCDDHVHPVGETTAQPAPAASNDLSQIMVGCGLPWQVIHKVDGAPNGWGDDKRRVLAGTAAIDDCTYLPPSLNLPPQHQVHTL